MGNCQSDKNTVQCCITTTETMPLIERRHHDTTKISIEKKNSHKSSLLLQSRKSSSEPPTVGIESDTTISIEGKEDECDDTHCSGCDDDDEENDIGHSHRSSKTGSIITVDKTNYLNNRNLVRIEIPLGKPIEEVYSGVHDGPVLGSGISGLVRKVTHRKTGVSYAVKCIDLATLDNDHHLIERLRDEIFTMCQLDHPNIVRLEEVYESSREIYLVQELCTGGELFDVLHEQADYHYTERRCVGYVKQMLRAVRYVHDKGVVHRDLKLENFLFVSKTADDNGDESILKLIDFGMSKFYESGQLQHEAVGTPYTVAPEVLTGVGYDERCDVWGIGVITYFMLGGDPPFGGCGGPESPSEMRENITRGRFAFEPREIWDEVSEGAKEFIRSLLVTDRTKRPTAREALELPWLKQQEWSSSAPTAGEDGSTTTTLSRVESRNKSLNPNVVKALISFKEYSDMRKLLCEVLSFTLLPDQIDDLQKEFEKLDVDDSGEISLGALKTILLQTASGQQQQQSSQQSSKVVLNNSIITEKDVEDIFDAMHIRKIESSKIKWHEFIAAALSQCNIDDRNLRLAFDRMDSDNKGYITLDDIKSLLGTTTTTTTEEGGGGGGGPTDDGTTTSTAASCTSSFSSEQSLAQMYNDALSDCRHCSCSKKHQTSSSSTNCNDTVNNKMTYNDFVNLMKAGQGRPALNRQMSSSSRQRRSSAAQILRQASFSILEQQQQQHQSITAPIILSSPTTRTTTLTKTAPAAAENDVSLLSSSHHHHHHNNEKSTNQQQKQQHHECNKQQQQQHHLLLPSPKTLRIAVIEASNRFTDEQIRRLLLEQQQQQLRQLSNDDDNEPTAARNSSGAGLMMRHGQDNIKLTTRDVRRILQERDRKLVKVLERVKRRTGSGTGGHGRRARRQRENSDLSILLEREVGREDTRVVTMESAVMGRSSMILMRDRGGRSALFGCEEAEMS